MGFHHAATYNGQFEKTIASLVASASAIELVKCGNRSHHLVPVKRCAAAFWINCRRCNELSVIL